MSNQNYLKEKALYNASEPISIDILKTIIEQTEKSICKIDCNEEGKGTGFFCVIPFPDKFNLLPVLITNNHVLPKKDISKEKIIKFSLNNEKQFFKISNWFFKKNIYKWKIWYYIEKSKKLIN